MSEERRLCDFNISVLTLKQIMRIFSNLIKLSSKQSLLMCQHTIKITNDLKKITFIQENCNECRSLLKHPNRKIDEKYQTTGVLIYLLGKQLIEQPQRISNYDLTQQLFQNYIGYYKDEYDFQSICSIFDLSTYQSIYNKIQEINSIRNIDEQFLLPIQREIKFEKYVLVVVNNFQGQLKNNDVVEIPFLIKSFKKFLEQYSIINQFISSDQLCIHNVNLRQKINDIWEFSINFYNIQCNCQHKGLAKLFFSFVTKLNYIPQNLDNDSSVLIDKVIMLIDEERYPDEFDNLQKIFKEYDKMFPSNYPKKDDKKKISFFSLDIQQILLKLREQYLWKGYQIYVLQDFIERIENEMILYNRNYNQYLNNQKREQVQQMQNFLLQNIQIKIFSKIIFHYSNLSDENSQQGDQLSEELVKKGNFVRIILQSQLPQQKDGGYQQLLDKRLISQQLRQSNFVHKPNILQDSGIQQHDQSSIISQQI